MSTLFSGWRRDLVNGLLSGGYLGLLMIGLHAETATGWMVSLGLIIPASIWAWHANLRRYRMIVDTPTARVASAPQGHVELSGRGRARAGEPLLAPFTQLPCLWYRYKVERRRGQRWYPHESGESDSPFGLDDGSGLAMIDPAGAEVVCTRKESFRRDAYRYTIWTLLAGDTLYALGEHVTLGSHDARHERRERLHALLSEWKADRETLLRRFDADGNNEIDLNEWEAVRAAAEQEVDLTPVPAETHPHLLRRPLDGRLYLIANRSVTELARHFRRWSVMHLVALAGAVIGLLALA